MKTIKFLEISGIKKNKSCRNFQVLGISRTFKSFYKCSKKNMNFGNFETIARV
jgi:hypothetical protein